MNCTLFFVYRLKLFQKEYDSRVLDDLDLELLLLRIPEFRVWSFFQFDLVTGLAGTFESGGRQFFLFRFFFSGAARRCFRYIFPGAARRRF